MRVTFDRGVVEMSICACPSGRKDVVIPEEFSKLQVILENEG